MPSKKPFFKPDVEEKILEFFDCYDSYVKNLVDSAEDPENRQHLQKLKNYTHNIILRRAGLETVTKCFGSRVVGTSIRSSNLNLYVDADKPSRVSEKNHAINVLHHVKGTMKRTKIWRVKILIENTPVPFLRVVFLPLNMEIDIVASSPIGMFDSDMFHHIMGLQPEAKYFFHFIRKWINEINDIRLKRMLILYLVVFYLQRVNVLPTIDQVHQGVKKEMVGGWEVQFDGKRTIGSYNKLNRMDSFEYYIIDFFQFYGSLGYADSVIDMFSGKVVKRRDYKCKDFNINAHLSVAAPLDRDRNVAQLVGKDTLAKFKKVCSDSAAYLKQNPQLLDLNEE